MPSTCPLQHNDGKPKPRDIQTSQNVAWFDRSFGLNLVWLFFQLNLAFEGPFCRCLVKPGIENRKTHVTERENAGDEKDSLTPTQTPLHARWD